MSTEGICLTRLTLKGPQVTDAEVRFTRGLNVFVGPSNTGKTFIAQCVDFMLGGSRTPKEIPEAALYDTVFLGLCIGDAGDELLLERSLRGGDFRLHQGGAEVRVLGEKHVADNDETVSHFFLSASGLTGKKVRTNQRGVTRPLSFRDIARLVLVDEVSVGADEAEDFSRVVEALLRSWYFPNLERVTFSEKDQDVVISGQRRASHGKGVRAITHAAFNLALLKYCTVGSKPHPGLVLIDSPLIVYRQPDTGEDNFTLDVKEGFYCSLAGEFIGAQVIILENDAPPGDLVSAINVIEFTGTNLGRRGFIQDSG